MNTVKIGNKLIGPGHRPFIIAEMSGNHNHSLERALAIVETAAKAGVQAIKLQTYTADTMTIDADRPEFRIEDPNSIWAGKSLYQLYQEAYTPWEWQKPIFDRCLQLGIIGFSTPFDATAVDFLESLQIPCYKVASFEVTDLPLIRKIAATGKPMIISTGMALAAEIDEAVRTARQGGCQDIILLKCSSSYPASPADTNLLTIPHMRDLFNCLVGLSDHTLGLGVALASIPLGAVVIEKHFTLSRADGGVDAAFSLEPPEMQQLVAESERAWLALGGIAYGPGAAEKQSFLHRRSLYIVRDMKAGDTFTPETLRIIRPGLGLPPKYYEVFLGKKITRDAPKGTPVSWELL